MHHVVPLLGIGDSRKIAPDCLPESGPVLDAESAKLMDYLFIRNTMEKLGIE
jgi:hypothetical protein